MTIQERLAEEKAVGLQEGLQKGLLEGRQEATRELELKQAKDTLVILQRLRTKAGLTKDQALDALGITEADVKGYVKLIAERNKTNGDNE